MRLRAPAPDVRYVGLVPSPRFRTRTIAAGGIGLSSIGLALGPHDALWSMTSGVLPAAIAAVAGVAFTASVARHWLRLKAPADAREVQMAIVPWGVIVDVRSEPRILRWPAVRSIEVGVKHSFDGGTPSIVSSVVTIRTDREAFSGYADGAVGLETLMANVHAYAEEASLPVSLDLGGCETRDEDLEPVPMAGEVLRRAVDLCTTGRGAAELALPPRGYRHVAASKTSPETIALLSRALEGDFASVADPRPLASFVVALLGARELAPVLVRLVNRPHPFVAAAARASALRLGVPPAKSGSLEELADFLAETDRHLLEQFAAGRNVG
ncbi:MAG TPA: hypothetical protein PKA58_02235 [Polyangium sp.]|nr:hypothetical protein [Polyangium sp.]